MSKRKKRPEFARLVSTDLDDQREYFSMMIASRTRWVYMLHCDTIDPVLDYVYWSMKLAQMAAPRDFSMMMGAFPGVGLLTIISARKSRVSPREFERAICQAIPSHKECLTGGVSEEHDLVLVSMSSDEGESLINRIRDVAYGHGEPVTPEQMQQAQAMIDAMTEAAG